MKDGIQTRRLPGFERTFGYRYRPAATSMANSLTEDKMMKDDAADGGIRKGLVMCK
jgi:hypothetical protein